MTLRPVRQRMGVGSTFPANERASFGTGHAPAGVFPSCLARALPNRAGRENFTYENGACTALTVRRHDSQGWRSP